MCLIDFKLTFLHLSNTVFCTLKMKQTIKYFQIPRFLKSVKTLASVIGYQCRWATNVDCSSEFSQVVSHLVLCNAVWTEYLFQNVFVRNFIQQRNNKT